MSDGPVLWCCPLLLFLCDDFGQVCLPFTNWTQKSKWLLGCAGHFLFPQPPFSVSYIIWISNLVLGVIYWVFLIARLYYHFELYWFPSSSFCVSSMILMAMSNRVRRSIPLSTIFPRVSTHVHLLYPPQAFICRAHLILLKKVFPWRGTKLKMLFFIRWAQPLPSNSSSLKEQTSSRGPRVTEGKHGKGEAARRDRGIGMILQVLQWGVCYASNTTLQRILYFPIVSGCLQAERIVSRISRSQTCAFPPLPVNRSNWCRVQVWGDEGFLKLEICVYQ